MLHVRLLSLALLATACTRTDGDGAMARTSNPIVADTQTVAGVLEMRHGADAFERAPQLTIEADPLVTITDGGRPEFDLTYVFRAVPLSDGRFVALNRTGGVRLVLFDAEGAPSRVIARGGEGPGDLRAPSEPVRVSGDTLMMIDGGSQRVVWRTVDSVVRTAPFASSRPTFCYNMENTTTEGHLIAIDACLGSVVRDTVSREAIPVMWLRADSGDFVTITTVPGTELVPFETRYRGVRRMDMLRYRHGGFALASAWGSDVAIATGAGGYTIERWSVAGELLGRIRVAVPRRAVTEAMREVEIAKELERLDGPASERMIDVEESRRQAREVPFADSLPPYVGLSVDSDGTLWVSDYAVESDTTWGVTGFRPDGAIVGRLVLPRLARPVRFWDDKVMLRELDADGVVRFEVYRIVEGE